MITKDKIAQKVSDKIITRANKGKIKFGDYMHETKKTRKEWLIDAQEECLDMALYLQKLIDEE